MADITLFELHLHDGLSFSKSSSPAPETTEPPVKAESEGEVAPGLESGGSGLPVKAVGALVALGLLAAVVAALKLKGDGAVPDEVDELSDAL